MTNEVDSQELNAFGSCPSVERHSARNDKCGMSVGCAPLVGGRTWGTALVSLIFTYENTSIRLQLAHMRPNVASYPPNSSLHSHPLALWRGAPEPLGQHSKHSPAATYQRVSVPPSSPPVGAVSSNNLYLRLKATMPDIKGPVGCEGDVGVCVGSGRVGGGGFGVRSSDTRCRVAAR